MDTDMASQSIFPQISSRYKSGFNKSLSRWANARTKNVNSLQELWLEDPLRVEVLEDPKFDDDHLIIMKKIHLEKLIKEHEELMEKIISRRMEMDLLIQTADLINELSKKEQIEEAPALKNAFSIFSKLSMKLAVI